MSLVEQPLFLVLIAFAIGIAAGRFWGIRTKRRESRSIGGAAATHYIAGIDFLATSQLDPAVHELTQAAKLNPDAPEIYLILGNLLREKGQLERAIQIHQSILQRPNLSNLERTHALLSLGMDFKRAGFRNRAMDTFTEVISLQQDNVYALLNLRKIHEEDHEWEKALAIQEKITEVTGSQQTMIVASLYDEIGLTALRDDQRRAAERHFETAIRSDGKLARPYLHLANVLLEDDRVDEAIGRLRTLMEKAPDYGYLAFETLERALKRQGSASTMEAIYQEIIERNDNDWRARLSLARVGIAQGQRDRAAELLVEALERNPHCLMIHYQWLKLIGPSTDETTRSHLVERYLEAFSEAVIFWDAHRCIKCGYRADGLLWRCPHCQEWNSFLEERLERKSAEGDAPA